MREIAVVLKGYPRLSETFIAQEILSLQQAGLPLAIYSLREPHDGKIHPVHKRITARVTYLPEYLRNEPLRVLRAWRRVRKSPPYREARDLWLRDLWRDPTPNRVRRFGQALVLADELPASTAALYAHFLHTPASVTRYAARLRALPWACSAHAKDIYTSKDWEIREKLADLAFLTTCTSANVSHLKALAPESAGKVSLTYHGLDLDRFGPPPSRPPGPDGRDRDHPVTILSVGRLVAKKGYEVLIEALAALPADLNWRFVHIGGGDRAALERLIAEKGLAGRVTLKGSAAQDEVIAAYRSADVFALASRIAGDGDRDGLPNVLMEAMSQRLACVSTAVSAIPEAIRSGETGLLVPPDDAPALAEALRSLITDPALRVRLGEAAEADVRRRFSHRAGIGALVNRLSRLAGLPEPVAGLSP